MKKSRKITLTVLAGLTLTGCLAAAGCGTRDEEPVTTEYDPDEPVDHTWYDEHGNAIPEQWKVDEHGNRVLDAEGRPVPLVTPHDRHGRPFMYHGGVWLPPLIVLGHSAYYGGAPRPMMGGGGGYRGPNSTTPYRGPNGAGSRPVVSPPAASRPSAPPAGSAIGRSGFGSTGGAASSGGAS